MTKKQIERASNAVSELNGFIDGNADFFANEFGCDAEDIVDYYGFGYCPSEKEPKIKFVEVDSIIDSKYTLEEIEEIIAEAKGDSKKEIEAVLRVQTEAEA